MNRHITKLQRRWRELMENKDEAGFTILELCIVLGILMIITAIAIPVYGDIRHTSRVAAVEGTAKNAYESAIVAIEDGEADSYATTVVGEVDSKDPNVRVFMDTYGGYENLERRFVCVQAVWEGSSGDNVPDVVMGDGCVFRTP